MTIILCICVFVYYMYVMFDSCTTVAKSSYMLTLPIKID